MLPARSSRVATGMRIFGQFVGEDRVCVLNWVWRDSTLAMETRNATVKIEEDGSHKAAEWLY